VELSREEQRRLLAIAREAIAARLEGRDPNGPGNLPARLKAVRAAFVCLKVGGRLRGCVGSLTATQPLWEAVRDMAAEAAFSDPRFMPLTPRELPRIELEISVLSPMEKTSDPSQVEVGRHGLLIRQGPHSGVLLPQVATEWGWDRQTFLAETCLKAGLEPDCWKRERTELYTFEAMVFGD
jgi:AmmeMemoRadiSam system protein A